MDFHEIEWATETTVKHIRSSASDDFVIQAAQVSAKGENKPETVSQRLIEALMKGRHGSPFEHTSFTFFVECPIFVAREWFRHRMSSFNEMSGRYTTLLPKFYILPPSRPIVNIGTKMKPVFESDLDRWQLTNTHLQEIAIKSWHRYQILLENGVANEVARMVLPLNIYTQFYWTVNARSLMNFLSLRVESEDSMFRSYPQQEIHKAAGLVEQVFQEQMPDTWYAFVKNGRVAP